MKIDFDFKDLDEWENFYRLFKAVTELSMVGEVTVKETRKGYHVYSTFETTPENEIKLREYFGDDSIRIMYDEERAKQSPHLYNVLYKTKVTGVVQVRKGKVEIVVTSKYSEDDVNV